MLIQRQISERAVIHKDELSGFAQVIPVLAELDGLSRIPCVPCAKTLIEDGPRGDELMTGGFFTKKRGEMSDCCVVMLIVPIVEADQEAGIDANPGH